MSGRPKKQYIIIGAVDKDDPHAAKQAKKLNQKLSNPATRRQIIRHHEKQARAQKNQTQVDTNNTLCSQVIK